jgi:hypothetical protein
MDPGKHVEQARQLAAAERPRLLLGNLHDECSGLELRRRCRRAAEPQAGIAQSVLHRFVKGERDLTLRTAEKLVAYFGMELRRAVPE